MRTTYDVEMMRQVGSCAGIENYSMHIDGRTRGSAPNCLLDYFPEDFVLVVDESHVAVPADRRDVRGRHVAQAQLVDHGFRLPSAMDNRPAPLGGVPRTDRADDLPLRDPRATTSSTRSTATSSSRSSARPGLIDPEVDRQADQGPDRRPDPRDQRPRPRRTSESWSPR
jgi:hypothetical protein